MPSIEQLSDKIGVRVKGVDLSAQLASMISILSINRWSSTR